MPQDLARAEQLMQAAADQGYAKAKTFLSEVRAARQTSPASTALPTSQPRPPPPLLGQRVVIHGLVSRPTLNGQCGTATAFDATADRYAVRIDGSGESLKVRAANLTLQGAEVAAGAVRESMGGAGAVQAAFSAAEGGGLAMGASMASSESVDAEAQYLLAVQYYQGDGMPQDDVRAAALLQRDGPL